MELSKMTTEQLKALVYDQMRIQSKISNNIQILENEIFNREQNDTKAPEDSEK
jgi:hypothetical protein